MADKEKVKYPPEYLFGRRRVEGQIKHTINEHPEWFNLPNEEIKMKCVRSTAKRIIGEIVAGSLPGNNQGRSAKHRASMLWKILCNRTCNISVGRCNGGC